MTEKPTTAVGYSRRHLALVRGAPDHAPRDLRRKAISCTMNATVRYASEFVVWT